MEAADSPNTAQSWDAYWRGAAEAGAWSAGGVGHPAIAAFWSDRFRALKQEENRAAMLDIASGNGAVIECAVNTFAENTLELTCVDISEPALANIRERFPQVRGVVCDASSLPLETAQFQLVTSQFGIEYAGPGAVDEALRVLAPGGRLILVMHHGAGLIRAECAASLDAIEAVQQSRFIPLALELFRTGFAAVRGADRAPYDAAAAQLAPALKSLEDTIHRHGESVAGGSVAQLYADVARIHGRMPHYESGEVIAWLQRMARELEAYAGRMSSMMDSALDSAAFAQLRSSLEQRRHSIEEAGPLLAAGQEMPLAWVLVARSG